MTFAGGVFTNPIVFGTNSKSKIRWIVQLQDNAASKVCFKNVDDSISRMKWLRSQISKIKQDQFIPTSHNTCECNTCEYWLNTP